MTSSSSTGECRRAARPTSTGRHLWPRGSLEAFDAAPDSQASGKVVKSLWLEQTEEDA